MVSLRWVKPLALKLEMTKKTVTVANEKNSNVLGKLIDVPVSIVQLKARLDPVVL